MSEGAINIDQATRQLINDIARDAAARVLSCSDSEDARTCAMFTDAIIRHGRNRRSAIRFADAVRIELVAKNRNDRMATEAEAEMKERAYAFIQRRGLWEAFAGEEYGYAPETQTATEV
jgi:hypothetical protein